MDKAWEQWCELPAKEVGPWLRNLDLEDWPELKALDGVQQCPINHPEGCVWTHTIEVCERMRASLDGHDHNFQVLMMLAALCHDLGKATTTKWNEKKGKWTAYGHDLAGVPIAASLLVSMGVAGDTICQVKALVACHMAHIRKPEELTPKAIEKLYHNIFPASMRQLVLLMKADCGRWNPLPPAIAILEAAG